MCERVCPQWSSLRKTGDGDFIKPHDKADARKAPQKSSLKSSLKGSLKSSLKILEILAAEPTCTYEELAERIGISRRAITKQIKNLRETGKLKRIGPDKGGHWEVLEKSGEKL